MREVIPAVEVVRCDRCGAKIDEVCQTKFAAIKVSTSRRHHDGSFWGGYTTYDVCGRCLDGVEAALACLPKAAEVKP